MHLIHKNRIDRKQQISTIRISLPCVIILFKVCEEHNELFVIVH